ncbi:MAG: hypothetical protein JSV17_00195 [Candidatus Aminicenantes bacterium]|nr:MAG: hypothetical protein JSV17_00195 [Candidatus Aminicenantes bacterium]
MIQKTDLPFDQTALLDAYKSGPIYLEQSRDFGKNTDWNALFYHLFCDMAVAPDGSIFIASSRQHKVYKFDPNGNLIKSFGQEGQGPGDFNMPGNLSILDGKILVIGDNPRWHRISLFDLEGNFKSVLKTQRPPFWPVALRDGKIAYIVYTYRGDSQTDREKISSVIIRDINSDEKIKIAECTFNMASLLVGQGSISFGDATSGEFFINSSKEKNLIVGNSLLPYFDVFSPDGTKISTFPLNIEPIPVTKRVISDYKKYQIDQMNTHSSLSQTQIQEMMKQLKKASWDHMFSENLPLYREVLMDTEGNLIVFRRTDCLGEECQIYVQVYSPDGEFICETELVEGPFELSIDPRIKNMCFTSHGLFAMVGVKDAPEFELRVIKVTFK